MSTTGSPATGNRFAVPPGRAIRIVVAGFGVLAGLAAIEHGVGEILQGPVRPDRLIIQSWPEQAVFEPLGGEPALIVIPNLLISGGAAVLVATALAAWAVAGVHRRHGPSILAVLSLVLLCVGGGFGPPLIGLILALGAIPVAVPGHRPGTVARSLARVWTWALAAGVAVYLGLVPGLDTARHTAGLRHAARDAIGHNQPIPPVGRHSCSSLGPWSPVLGLYARVLFRAGDQD